MAGSIARFRVVDDADVDSTWPLVHAERAALGADLAA
jgi:hypothetical protein